MSEFNSNVSDMPLTLDVEGLETFDFDEFNELYEKIINKEISRPYYTTDDRIAFAARNQKVQERILNKIDFDKKLYNELYSLDREWLWLVITEHWCNDSAYSLPVLYAASECSDKIDFKIILRDDYDELMDTYFLTGGKSRSIPKMACIDKDTNEILGQWGPRPAHIQEFVMNEVAQPTMEYQDRLRETQRLYIKDNSRTAQLELLDFAKQWK